MRRNTAWSALSATTCSCSFFFLLRRFDVRIWRPYAWPRTTLPVPVFLNRLDAPLWVFNFGIKNVPRGNCGNSDYSTADSGIKCDGCGSKTRGERQVFSPERGRQVQCSIVSSPPYSCSSFHSSYQAI